MSHGAGEAAFAMTKEFRLNQVLLERAAVDNHKWFGRTRALLVDEMGQQVFAGAGLALQQNGDVGSGGIARLVQSTHHGLGLRNDAFMHTAACESTDGSLLVRDGTGWRG